MKYILAIIIAMIWTLAIGSLLYEATSGSCVVVTSMTSMSTAEIEEYNNGFTKYDGKQSGASVRKLIDNIIMNAQTYRYEVLEMPRVMFNIDGENITLNANDENGYDYDDYILELRETLKRIKTKTHYNVTSSMGANGLIEEITIENIE